MNVFFSMKVPLNSMTYRLKPVDCFVEAELIVNIVNNISSRQSHGRYSPVKMGINNLLGNCFPDDITPKLLLCQEIVITIKESKTNHRVTGGSCPVVRS